MPRIDARSIWLDPLETVWDHIQGPSLCVTVQAPLLIEYNKCTLPNRALGGAHCSVLGVGF